MLLPSIKSAAPWSASIPEIAIVLRNSKAVFHRIEIYVLER